MHFQEGAACDLPQVKIENLLPEIGKDEVIKGILEDLTCANKRISSMFFYDEGMDMVKDRDVIFRAYNDHRNVTAKFNRNILNVVNGLVGTNLDPNYFEHLAFFNEKQARIEMHLRAMKDIETFSPYSPTKITVEKGETIHTENSHKFTKEHIDELAKTAGLKVQKIFTDKDNWFSLVQFTKDAWRDLYD